MHFTYVDGVPTVEQAMAQAVGHFTKAGSPEIQGALDGAFAELAGQALTEIRTILTGELATLLDRANVAADWNDAVEHCIRLVEGSLS